MQNQLAENEVAFNEKNIVEAASEDISHFQPSFLTRPARTWSRLLLTRTGTSTNSGTTGQSHTSPAQGNPRSVSLRITKLTSAAQSYEQERANLCLSITGGTEDVLKHQHSWKWFCNHIEYRADLLWTQMFAQVLREVPLVMGNHKTVCLTALFHVLSIVADQLSGDSDITLPGLVSKLESKQLLNDGVDHLATQMVFQLVGWVCAIWDPSPDSKGNALSLRHPNPTRRRRLGGIIQTTKIHTSDITYQSIGMVARIFGKLIPVPDQDWDRDVGTSYDIEAASVPTAYLNFHDLQGLAKVRIVWTRTLAQHLEYDSRQKVLYVFAIPSLCLLLYRENGLSLLSQTFERERNESHDDVQSSMTGPSFSDFLLEVLQSYQCIFGAHEKSRRIMSRQVQQTASVSGMANDCDPLLRKLCTEGPASQEIRDLYSELDLDAFEDHVPLCEFPFLGRRLLRLHRINMEHNPRTLRRLWNDRRNPTTWFALWAVLIIGLGTLVFQILQFIFQIVQL